VRGARGRRVPPDEEDEDDENYHAVKEEAMEDVPPGARYLPPEYQALVAGSYDEEALLLQALEVSKVDKDKVFPGYSEAIKLTGLVANHLASLPPPAPLLPHARPFADYEGQKVPTPSGVSRRQRHHDHPQGVVINRPPQPQQEVFVDLVFDDDE
jgi:hypothetical protein